MVCLESLLAPPQDGEADLACRHSQPMEISSGGRKKVFCNLHVGSAFPFSPYPHATTLHWGTSPTDSLVWENHSVSDITVVILSWHFGWRQKACILLMKIFLNCSFWESHRNHIFIMSYVLKYYRHNNEVSIPWNILVRYYVVSRSSKCPLPVCHMPQCLLLLYFYTENSSEL